MILIFFLKGGMQVDTGNEENVNILSLIYEHPFITMLFVSTICKSIAKIISAKNK